MPANISMNTYDANKGYDKVILQQGQPITDYDFNETQDILRGRIRSIINDIFGNCSAGDGWKIIGTGATNDFTVNAGSNYIDGYRITLAANGTASATFGLTLTTPSASRIDRVYLDVYEIEIDSTTDPAIVHTKLKNAGLEPTRRIKIKADLKIVEGGSIPSATTGHYFYHLASINRTANNSSITQDMITDTRRLVDFNSLFGITIGHNHNGINSKKLDAANINLADSGSHYTAVTVEDALDEIYEALNSHATAAVLAHPDNSVTDAKIGNRTIDATLTGGANSGTITQHLSWLAKIIKGITGKTNWFDAPSKSIETLISDDSTHKNATTLDHPDNSVTDAKIGNRTISDATTPADTTTLTNGLGGLANMIKAITGKSGWKTTPAITLEATNTKFDLTNGHKHTGAAGDAPTLGTSALQDNAITDAKVGNRTVTDTTAPSSDTGNLTTLFSNIGNMIKGITGKTNWRTAPAITLEATNTKFDTTNGHKHTGAAGDAPVLGTTALADNAITDAKIGSRTITDTTAPTADTAQLNVLLNNMANMLKKVTGKSSWRTDPATSIETISSTMVKKDGTVAMTGSLTTPSAIVLTTSLAATAAPSAYATGISYMAVSGDSSYPTAYGSVITFKLSSSRCFQIFQNKNDSGAYYRNQQTDTDAWLGWSTYITTVGTGLYQEIKAGFNIANGNTITHSATGELSWDGRFIVASNGRGSNFSTDGYYEITMPASGTVITGVGGATNTTVNSYGIPIQNYYALYYILPIGSGLTTVTANFRLAYLSSNIDIPSNWLLIAIKTDNGILRVCNGINLKIGQSWSGSKGYTDIYVNSTNINNAYRQLKVMNIGDSGSSARWFKIAKIQSFSTINDGNENTTFTGRVYIQYNFGYTANKQYIADFSFGVRNIESNGSFIPLFNAYGDAAKATDVKFAIYRHTDGYHWLYFVQPPYSRFVSFEYTTNSPDEQWTIVSAPDTGSTLIWESTSGGSLRQSMTGGDIFLRNTDIGLIRQSDNNMILKNTEYNLIATSSSALNGIWLTQGKQYTNTGKWTTVSSYNRGSRAGLDRWGDLRVVRDPLGDGTDIINDHVITDSANFTSNFNKKAMSSIWGDITKYYSYVDATATNNEAPIDYFRTTSGYSAGSAAVCCNNLGRTFIAAPNFSGGYDIFLCQSNSSLETMHKIANVSGISGIKMLAFEDFLIYASDLEIGTINLKRTGYSGSSDFFGRLVYSSNGITDSLIPVGISLIGSNIKSTDTSTGLKDAGSIRCEVLFRNVTNANRSDLRRIEINFYSSIVSDSGVLTNASYPTGLNSNRSLAFDGRYFYFVTDTAPAKVVRCEPYQSQYLYSAYSTNVALASGNNNASSIIYFKGDLYIGLATSPAKLVKFNPVSMTAGTIYTAISGENKCIDLTTDGEYIYMYLSTKQILKINPSSMTKVENTLNISTGLASNTSCLGQISFDGLNLVIMEPNASSGFTVLRRDIITPFYA